MILKDTETFQVLFIIYLFCAWNITTVEINSGVYLLYNLNQSSAFVYFRWSWSWSCYFDLGLKNFVLFISLENTYHTWALLRWWFTTKRRAISSVSTFTLLYLLLPRMHIWCCLYFHFRTCVIHPPLLKFFVAALSVVPEIARGHGVAQRSVHSDYTRRRPRWWLCLSFTLRFRA